MQKTLIIGYGNTLRSDDGAGQKVAEAFFDMLGVEAIALHQLTPELAENIAQAEQVYFVDAAPINQLKIQAIKAKNSDDSFGHFIDPQSLLTLTENLYNAVPKTYLILIPATNFEIGETFSEITQTAIQQAIQLLQNRVLPCMK